jgi:RNA polymerase sigma-70 factor (ECF subfamily)
MSPALDANSPGEVTQLLEAMRQGDAEAGDILLGRIYATLQTLARAQLSRERPDHTLQATVLVHDAWLRLTGGGHDTHWENRAHFYAAASRAMRRLLVDHARARRAGRRRADLASDLPAELAEPTRPHPVDLIALDEALTRLAGEDERAHRVVELRYFSGLAFEDIATVVGVSVPTVKRDWRFARAWLRRELDLAPDDPLVNDSPPLE